MKKNVIFLLMVIGVLQAGIAQPIYNNCNSAAEICPNKNFTFTNVSANVTVCPGCEDDFNYCFSTENTIWITFTTNAAGGNVQVDFSNLVFQNAPGQGSAVQTTLIQAAFPCDATTYTQVGTCLSNETANFTLNCGALAPNTTYYLVVDGDNTGAGVTSPAECTFDVIVSGPGIDRPVPAISITESNITICLNDIVTFTADTLNCPNIGDYSWMINGNLVATTTDPVFETSALQDGDIVTVQTHCYTQCVDTVSVDSPPISVYSFPLDAGSDITIHQGESLQLFGSTTAPVYSWEPTYFTSNPDILNPIVVPTETTVFSLTATENGCTLTDQVTVTVEEGLTIPNTFSPNGDSNNDTWVILGIDQYPDNFVQIYDRWGQSVFQTSGYSDAKAWDGTIRGRKATESVYFYVVDLRDGSGELLKGSITLIR